MATFVKKIKLAANINNRTREYTLYVFEKSGGAGYTVEAEYAYIGNSPSYQILAKKPVSFNEAVTIFDEVVAEKAKEGYRIVHGSAFPAPMGVNPPTSDAEKSFQLAAAVDLSVIKERAATGAYLIQQEEEGTRIGVMATAADAAFYHGPTEPVMVHECLYSEISALIAFCGWENAQFDGVVLDDTFTIIDVLSVNNDNMRGRPFFERNTILKQLQEAARSACEGVHVAYAVSAKDHLDEYLENRLCFRGVVLKLGSSVYRADAQWPRTDHVKYSFISASSGVSKVMRQPSKLALNW